MSSLLDRGGSKKTYLGFGGTVVAPTSTYDKFIVIEDATFSVFESNWVNGSEVTALPAGVYPGTIVNMTITAGRVLLLEA